MMLFITSKSYRGPQSNECVFDAHFVFQKVFIGAGHP